MLDIATDDAPKFCNPTDLAQVFSDHQEEDLRQWRPICLERLQQISIAWVGGSRIGQKGSFKARDYLCGDRLVLRTYEPIKDGSPKVARATKRDSERAHEFVAKQRSADDVSNGKHMLPFPSCWAQPNGVVRKHSKADSTCVLRVCFVW